MRLRRIAEAGNVYLPENAEWLGSFLRITAAFPAVRFDDDVDAMSQFLNWRRGRSTSLGLVDYFKRIAKEIGSGIRDFYGQLIDKPAPKPVPVPVRKEEAVIRTEAPKKKANDPCLNPDCRSTATVLMSDGYGGLVVYCNQCHAKDGVLPAVALLGCKPGCPAFVKQFAGGRVFCGNCHGYHTPAPVLVGMGFKEYNRRRNRFAWK